MATTAEQITFYDTMPPEVASALGGGDVVIALRRNGFIRRHKRMFVRHHPSERCCTCGLEIAGGSWCREVDAERWAHLFCVLAHADLRDEVLAAAAP